MRRQTRLVGILLVAVVWMQDGTAAGNEFDCMINPAQVVEVRSPVVGILSKVHVKRGEKIRKGDLLVSIESSAEQSASKAAGFRAEARGSLLIAQNRVSASRQKARRFQELYEVEFVSAQARDDAVAEMAQAESELKLAEENSELAKIEHQQSIDQLNRRQLRSPFNGVVVDQYLYPGALVDIGDGRKPVIKIAQTQPLIVEALVPLKFFPQVKTGMNVVVLPEKPFSAEIPAVIKTVDRVVDSAAGTFGVVAELANSRQELPGGIRCRLRIPGLK